MDAMVAGRLTSSTGGCAALLCPRPQRRQHFGQGTPGEPRHRAYNDITRLVTNALIPVWDGKQDARSAL
jgi:hypothetical protein